MEHTGDNRFIADCNVYVGKWQCIHYFRYISNSDSHSLHEIATAPEGSGTCNSASAKCSTSAQRAVPFTQRLLHCVDFHHRQFLRFAFRGRHFQFRVLPFGLSLSPRVFTSCFAAALLPLQAQVMKILPYRFVHHPGCSRPRTQLSFSLTSPG